MKYVSDLPFRKGNLHAHTTRSDGRLSPTEAIEFYREAGYGFLALTDHWVFNSGGEFGGMTVLSGAEFDFPMPEQTVHLACVGLSEADFLAVRRDGGPAACARRIMGSGAAAILAHPAWSLNTTEMIRSLMPLTAAEVYNAVSAPPWTGRADSSSILDVAAANGAPLPHVGADDAHFYTTDAREAWIMLQAERFDAAGILASLRERRFYATQGPRFRQVERISDRLIVECDEVMRATFLSNAPWVPNRCAEGPLTRAEYRIDASDRFVRVELQDASGDRAWFGPIAV